MTLQPAGPLAGEGDWPPEHRAGCRLTLVTPKGLLSCLIALSGADAARISERVLGMNRTASMMLAVGYRDIVSTGVFVQRLL